MDLLDKVFYDIAEVLNRQYEMIEYYPSGQEDARAQLRYDTIKIASIYFKHKSSFDQEAFFRRAGFEGPYPISNTKKAE